MASTRDLGNHMIEQRDYDADPDPGDYPCRCDRCGCVLTSADLRDIDLLVLADMADAGELYCKKCKGDEDEEA